MRHVAPHVLTLALCTLSQAALAQTSASDFGMPISSAVTVTFPVRSAIFRPDAEQVAQLADADKAALVTIRGRTSTIKPSARDESLGLARALSARSYLVARGVSPLKIMVNFVSGGGYIADNTTPAGRLENQRVEVELIYVTPLTN